MSTNIDWGIQILDNDPDFEPKIIVLGGKDNAPKRADYFIKKSPDTRVLLHRTRTVSYSEWIEDHE